jgi:hypothetical protein
VVATKYQRYCAIQLPIATLPRPRPARIMLMFQTRNPIKADDMAPVLAAVVFPRPIGFISRRHIGPWGSSAGFCTLNMIGSIGSPLYDPPRNAGGCVLR